MQIRYTFKLRNPVVFEDFRPIPFMDGQLSALKYSGRVTGFLVEIGNQNPNLSPSLKQAPEADVRAHIVGRDKLLPLVKTRIEDAFSYLQCYFNVEIDSGEVETEYIAEAEEEIQQIQVTSFKIGKNEVDPIVPFEIFARAIMAAGISQSPKLESSFLQMARLELLKGRYIDSFRYSFLLIEAVYGGGKIKSSQLKQELNGNPNFVQVVMDAISERIKPYNRKQCDTENLLSAGAQVETIIDHIVDKRGFYFHGNVKKSKPWRPHEQEEAESLSLLAFAMASLIADEAARPMFDEVLVERQHEAAKGMGRA